MGSSKDSVRPTDIAIIGMAGRFPGARTLEDFWRNLRGGVDAITDFTDEELRRLGVSAELLANPKLVKASAVLDDDIVEGFDAEFFGYSRREAELTDPQQRIFLECSWEVFERAGYRPDGYPGLVGVFAGQGLTTYFFQIFDPNFITSGDDSVLIGNDKEFLSTRVSYQLNLRGPSLTVQSACSTSLVAVHLGCQSLLNYECDMALAGGSNISVPQRAGYLYHEGGPRPPDGRCRAFDARGEGTILGNGVGVVLLKRLSEALEDGDRVYAVIKGSAVANDGSARVGFRAPGVDGQTRVIMSALANAEVHPDTIDYVECHGTATPLGDPIEITSLTKAFRAKTNRKGYCAIGSLKTNLTHLGAASGVASLIKTVLSLQNREIPPSLHFERPNPKIDFDSSPFFVNTSLREWQKAGSSPRRAGVSAFGLGGTNAHIILEEAPPQEAGATAAAKPWKIVPLSARNTAALEQATDSLVEHLRSHPALDLADAAYTLQVGRTRFAHRRILVCRDTADAVAALATRDPNRVLTRFNETGDAKVAFLFSGVGEHYPDMGAGLYRSEPAFRQEVDRCCEILRPLLGLDLRTELFPGTRKTSDLPTGKPDLKRMLGRGQAGPEAPRRIDETWLAQPAVFTIEYALARLWMSWGVQPQALLGYSLGEYVAACLAGVFSLENALELVARRARMIQDLPPGAMLGVSLPEAQVTPLLGEELSVSAVNGPALTVVAGPVAAVEDLERRLGERGVACRRLHTTHAFHSRMMDPLVEPYGDVVARVRMRGPKIPFLSNVTGRWITVSEAVDPGYWARHMRQPVRFADGVAELAKTPGRVLVEIGAGNTLSSLVQQMTEREEDRRPVTVASLPHVYDETPDEAYLLTSLGRVWMAGAQIDWQGLHAGGGRQRVPLPTYPFQRQRYWIDRRQNRQAAQPASPASRSGRRDLVKLPDPADWFHTPGWKRSVLVQRAVPAAFPEGRRWLLFLDAHGIGTALAARLRELGQEVITVEAGERFRRIDDRSFVADPSGANDLFVLMKTLRTLETLPGSIVHLWSLDTPADRADGEESPEAFARAQGRGLFSLLSLARALAREGVSDPVNLWVASTGLHAVESGDVPRLEQVPLLAACKVLPQEYSNLTCRSLDLILPAADIAGRRRVVEQLLAELVRPSEDPVAAYRGDHRWTQVFDRVQLPAAEGALTLLRHEGVYVLIGPIEGMVLETARHLAADLHARLALLEPSPGASEESFARAEELEALGAEVMLLDADLAAAASVRQAIADAEARFGAVHGVFFGAGGFGKHNFATVAEMGPQEWQARIGPRAASLLALEAALEGRELELCVLFSSLSSVLGGLGAVGNTSLAILADSLAQRRHSCPWLSVGFDSFEVSAEGIGLTAAEGVEALRRALATSGLSHLAVSTADLSLRIQQWIRLGALRPAEPEKRDEPEPAAAAPSHSHHGKEYVAPRNEMEERIAEVWKKLLGTDRVGAHDDFFDLGGHSLLATQLVSRLREVFHVDLSLNLVYQAPTLEGLAGLVEAALVARLEELDDEEAERRLSA